MAVAHTEPEKVRKSRSRSQISLGVLVLASLLSGSLMGWWVLRSKINELETENFKLRSQIREIEQIRDAEKKYFESMQEGSAVRENALQAKLEALESKK